MKMNILHTEWGDGWGGQEIRILTEMKALRERGLNLYLACTEHAKLGQEAKKLGFDVYYLPFKGNWDIKTLIGIRTLIKKLDIDIVNTHSSKDTLVGGLAAKLSGCRFIRTRHLSIPIKKTSLMNRLADHVITTGESVRQSLIDHSGLKEGNVTSIPTGFDQTVFDPAQYDHNLMRRHFNLVKDEVAIGIVAVLRGGKRHDLFLQMGRILKQKAFNVRLFIAGDGPVKESIKSLVEQYNMSDYVTILGYVDQPAKLLSALDFFVLTSDAEGVPQSVIQALAMNKATLATDVGSTADLYSENNFLLIPKGEPDHWAKQIEYLLNHPEEKKRLEVNARRSVIMDFSIEAMINKTLKIYQKVLKRKDNA